MEKMETNKKQTSYHGKTPWIREEAIHELSRFFHSKDNQYKIQKEKTPYYEDEYK